MKHRAPCRWHHDPTPSPSPCHRQTGEAVKVLLQRLQVLQGERAEAYRLFEE